MKRVKKRTKTTSAEVAVALCLFLISAPAAEAQLAEPNASGVTWGGS